MAITQIFSSDISQNAIRYVTEEIISSGTSPRAFNITYNPIGFSNMLSHAHIEALTAGMLPSTVGIDSGNNIYFVDQARIRQITPTGAIFTISGSGGSGFSGDNGPAASGTFLSPQGIDVDGSGNILIADSQNNRIRKISSSGILTTVVGNGTFSSTGNGGPAVSGTVGFPGDVAWGPSGSFYIAENNEFVRYVNPAGIISVVAGDGGFGPGTYTGDGTPATGLSLQNPWGVLSGPSGSFYFSNTFSHIVIKVNSSGLMTKIAGLDFDPGYNGENIPATGAKLSFPTKLDMDSSGNLYIAESFNNTFQRIRKVNTSGIITTYAGNGVGAYGGDGGQASGASLYMATDPAGFVLDTSGNMYIADYNNGRIRKVNTTGVISTYAGYGNTSFTEGQYLFDSMYVPFNYINSVITNPPDSVRYCNTSGTNMYVNLDNLAGFDNSTIDKFIISYTTNE